MELGTSIIETGVDKLVNLVNSSGKISAFDAEKELGVSNTVIMEWADFLEEEGIIRVEYKFAKPFLVSRTISKKDVKVKVKEFSGKREIFIRKAEGSLNFLQKEALKLNSIKVEFDKIKKELGFDIDSVRKELEDLEKYEKLKIDLDKQIEDQKNTSMEKVEILTRDLTREKHEYDKILVNIKNEENNLERERDEAKSLEKNEKLIMERLDGIKEIINQLESNSLKEDEHIKISEKNIQRLTLMAQSVRIRIEKEKEEIEPLILQSEEQTIKIKELQERIISKIADKEDKIKGAKNVSGRMKDLFKRKMGILIIIEKMNKNSNELQSELIELIRKAKSFQLSSDSTDIGNQIKDIEDKFNEVDKKKKVFEKELKKLSSFFR